MLKIYVYIFIYKYEFVDIEIIIEKCLQDKRTWDFKNAVYSAHNIKK